MISCVIHTYNSELYLDQVLAALKFCDEIVIVDMHSSDATLEIAQRHNVKIYHHENLGFADPARRYGVQCCTHEWILAIDSDEIVPQKLAENLLKISNGNETDVVFIPFRNFMFGREILGSGWGYRNQVLPRFFKRNLLSYGDEVHNFIKVSPAARTLRIISHDCAIIHFNYDSISQFIGKLDRYTNFETRKKRKIQNPSLAITYQFFREFIGRFLILKGYRDGWLGAYLSLAMAFYRATVIAKQELPNREQVIEIYKHIGHD